MMRGALATRLATPADAAAIAAIYSEGIADRIATFETDARTAAQIEAQLRDKGDRFPTVVAERDGQPRAPRALRVPRGGRLPAPR